MEITGKTRVLGIFGYPIRHTLSPLIHNSAFRAKGLDLVYLPFEVTPENLEEAVKAIRALNLLGINVTVPHKEAILPFLDEVSEDVLLSGAVNTVLNREGFLIGYNTDGEGYIKSLKKDAGFEPRGKSILILGAGGAARGILASIAKRAPERVVISNRTLFRASKLVEVFGERFPEIKLKAIALDSDILDEHLKETHLLINATTMGMNGTKGIELPLNSLSRDAVVSDIVYKPVETAIIKKAKSLGVKTHNGLGMLLGQGALSFKIWTGIDPPIDVMKGVLLRVLLGNTS